MSEMLDAGLFQAIEAIFNDMTFAPMYQEVLLLCGQIGADSEDHAKKLITSSIWGLLVGCLQASHPQNLKESAFAVTLTLETLESKDAHQVLQE